MKIADLQLDGWGTHWPPEAWPVSRCSMLFSVYSLLSLFFFSFHLFFFYFYFVCVCVSLPIYFFHLCLHQWCLQAKPPGLGSAERGVTNNAFAKGALAAARGTHTTGKEVPGASHRFILRVLLTDAVKPGTRLSSSGIHIAFSFEVMIAFGPVLWRIYFSIKISIPSKWQRIVFLLNHT